MTPEALAHTHAAAFTQGRPWRADEFAALLSAPGVILLGDARSFLLARVIAGEAEVLTIATHPDFRRQGLAKTLVATFLDSLETQHIESAFLEVAEDNLVAKQLYSKQGFQTVGVRPNYYKKPSGEKIGAAVMRYDV